MSGEFRAMRRPSALLSLTLLVAAIALAAFAAWRLWPHSGPGAEVRWAGGPVADWPIYGRDAGGTRYSPLEQIDRENVARLEVAWVYHTGDVNDGSDGRPKTTFQATPILVEGTLYLSTVYGRVIALDPETGAERWTHDPGLDRSVRRGEYASRGVAYWRDAAATTGQTCVRRIFLGTIDARLIALDAATGKPCAGFGRDGQVDLTEGVRLRSRRDYGVTSPPAVIAERIVVGSAIGDNRAVEQERGVVRAFDARSGALVWRFDPVPLDPADPARRAWRPEQADRTGSGNVWAPISVDEARGLVFIPTSSASPDYYGGERLGSNVYADSVVALRGATGEVVWHYQIVHHNLWDYDLPAQPVLLSVRQDGREIPAVAQATKMGFLFLLHRETGVPIFPVEERPVPRSDVPGEESWPTQPFPTVPPPLAPLAIGPEDAWGITFWDKGRCREEIARYRNEGIFTPPSFRGSLQYPGIAGGANWGSLAFEPQRGWVVLNMSNLPFVIRLIPRERYAEARSHRPRHTEFARQEGTPLAMSRRPLLSPFDMPCNRPPWGTVLAVELSSGRVVWKVPLGTVRDIAPLPLPIRYGTPNLGGPIVTAGGLVFIAAAMDDYLRAFDIDTGEELWKGRLPAGGQATPMTYRLREDGRQFVVIAAGGHGRMGTRLGDALVAFALPPD
ncbi:MAG: pyrroloquinoline quinone-dependent dehydrogenase [Betaproteobacteria bacterium]|nr:pyrroloquinoline quinone-dependent dehydrogenase [Betaproteobacteria bacterium]MDH5579365.1 pyrroloquinoline quinone-dependent dehydrogenase [Betaproteobacteria bacterium]